MTSRSDQFQEFAILQHNQTAHPDYRVQRYDHARSVFQSHTNLGPARETSRETARLTVTLGQQVADQLESDPTYRIMVFCAGEGLPFRESDIAFPHNVELKCNSDEVKVNLRGLKNRPGSTKPADITDFLRKKPPNYPNIVEMIYALTSKVCQRISFYVLSLLCPISKLRIIMLTGKTGYTEILPSCQYGSEEKY